MTPIALAWVEADGKVIGTEQLEKVSYVTFLTAADGP